MPKLTTHRASLISGLFIFITLAWHGAQYPMSGTQIFFLSTASLSTTLLLLVPVWIIQRMGDKFIPWKKAVALISNSLYFLLIILVLVDYKLYSLYGFHINGFVLNLTFTPGGLESLGANSQFYIIISEVLFIAALIFFSIIRFLPIEKLLPAPLKQPKLWLGAFLLSFAGQSYSYALAEYSFDKQVLTTADRIAFHIQVTAKSLFEKMGVDKPPRRIGSQTSKTAGKLDYPKAAISVSEDNPKPNIIWLVAESLRADMLDPEIMPNMWQFAQEGLNATKHYSGGNGTRMGLFSQFYSLNGVYWFDVLREHRQPVLFDVLKQLGYSKKAITSARFSYPEFDQTIFSGFRDSELLSYDEGEGWQRDQKNVGKLLSFMQSSDEPYFGFMFFESPHANYYFPPEAVIRPTYLTNFNYATMDLEKDIWLIKNRYINACHHLDQQLQRVIDQLKDSGSLNNTIVIITGDHGEEFMENGHWGHNSTFVEQQIRVPLIIAGAGISPGTLNKMSSHVDLIPTLLPLLGVTNQAADYGFGDNLLDPGFKRHYSVVTDWHGSALVTDSIKFILSKKAAYSNSSLTTVDDTLLEENNVSITDQQLLGQYMQQYARYFKH